MTNIGLRAVICCLGLKCSPKEMPSDSYLFPKIKKELSGRHFDSDDYVMLLWTIFWRIR